jgi:glucose-1-phosphate adenylyltransferase
MQDVLTLILGGGRGAGLYPLTRRRSEPAVPLAGKYRLIDVPVSNCLNSGLNRVYVLTQFQSASLHRHLGDAYQFDPFGGGFVEELPARQTNEAADWYRGTADALRQNLHYVRADGCRDVLVLSGDQLYRMDFRRLLAAHHGAAADVTVAAAPVDRGRARRLGVLQVDDADRVVALVEKPQADVQFAALRTPPAWLERRGAAGRGDYLANMGIYLFRRAALCDLLGAAPAADDLVREILIPRLGDCRVQAHLFTGYWEDLGAVKAYFEAHLALAGDNPPFDFHSPEGVIYTRIRNLPASRVRDARVDRCLISDGCEVGAGAVLERCVVGVRSRIGAGAVVREAVLLGADRVETPAERAENRRRGLPDVGVGDGAVVERAVVDRDCRIGRGARVVNRLGLRDHVGDDYVIRDGVVVLPEKAVVPDGAVI